MAPSNVEQSASHLELSMYCTDAGIWKARIGSEVHVSLVGHNTGSTQSGL